MLRDKGNNETWEKVRMFSMNVSVGSTIAEATKGWWGEELGDLE